MKSLCVVVLCIFPIQTGVYTSSGERNVIPSESVSNLLGANVLRGQPLSLFDGKTLSGWTRVDGTASKNWIVEDGTILRRSGGGDLYHEHWYRDFELSFEWKLEKNGNSGVKYRVQPFGQQMLGCEYQLQDDKGNDFHLHATGGLYAVYEPSKNKSAPLISAWNASKIVVCGQQVEHWLNGERILAATIGDSDWYARVNKSKFKDKAGFGLNRDGRIFLQDHGNPVAFRNIVVVPLESSQPGLPVVR